MFWTAFIWGLGVSFGASFGILFLIVMLAFVVNFCTSERVRKSAELAEAANVALTRRNDLTEKQIGQLTAIAASLSTIADASEEMVDSQ
jgi:uncharacterized membrane protein